jgi:pyruvate/2-oxoglutarate/acetoin dehydrogenase E1 component
VRNTELGKPVTMLEAIREALWEEMERDPTFS